MPHATSKYRFEWKTWEWAAGFAGSLAGHPHIPFLILFTATGSAERVLFGSAPESHEDSWQPLRDATASWLFFDPFEGPEYQYLCWQGLEQRTLERLIGAKFSPDDFSAHGETIEFPAKWGVMF